MQIPLTLPERELIEEEWSNYMKVVLVIARLHGLRGAVALSAQRDAFEVPDAQ